MLKNLSVAAILLAAALVSAVPDPTTPATTDPAGHFDATTLDKTKKKKSSSSSSSSGSSSSDSSSSKSSSSDSSSSSSDSESDKDKKSKKKDKVKYDGHKAFKKGHKKWLKSFSKAKSHDIAVIRQKTKIDHKGKKHKKARKSKYALVKNALKLKSKKPIKVTVEANGIKKGLTVKDGDKKLFKVKDSKYAILKEGSHAISVAANKKKVEGTATIKVEEVKLSKKINKKFKIVSATVKAKDAQGLCERFGGNLAEIKEKDIKKIVKAAKKLVKAGIEEVWIDRLIKDDDNYQYLPYALDLKEGKVTADPDNVYEEFSEYADKKIANIDVSKDKKKKYKKALEKVQTKIRKHIDKALDGKDETKPRAVLCRFD